MGAIHDDLMVQPSDYDVIDQEDAIIPAFKFACQHGPLSTVQSIVTSSGPPRTGHLLHQGLVIALQNGNVDITHYLLSVGAPIICQTPFNIFSAPVNQQVALFELFLKYGWTVNTPEFYGATALTRVLNNGPLLNWFLAHGADPNLGKQRHFNDRMGRSDTNSCLALEKASGDGNVEVVRRLWMQVQR